MVLANGTEATITPTSHPHLFRAMGTSVGRLGVITELTMKIIPQEPVKKSVTVRCARWAQHAGRSTLGAARWVQRHAGAVWSVLGGWRAGEFGGSLGSAESCRG